MSLGLDMTECVSVIEAQVVRFGKDLFIRNEGRVYSVTNIFENM